MPDLTGPRAVVQRLMGETCTVERPGDRSAVDQVDEVTLKVMPGAEPTAVYTGACLVTHTGAGTFAVKLPYDAADVEPDDVVAVTASERDPQLVGRRLKVTDVTRTSFLVWRPLTCDDITPGRA